MLNSDLSPAAPQGGRFPPTDKTRVVSTRRRVPTNWVSGRTLQPSIESVVANSFVPSDFLVDGQVSGLGTVHPLLTLSFVSTWILPLHVVSSTLKRKSSSSVMDGLQRRRRFLRKTRNTEHPSRCTHFTAESTEAMQIKCLAQGHNNNNIIIIIIMVIFKCYFSGEHIARSINKKQQRCEHRIRKNQHIKSTVHDAN